MAPTFSGANVYGAEIFHTLKGLLKAEGHVVAVGDEGGFAPRLNSNEEALDFIMKAIEKAGYRPEKKSPSHSIAPHRNFMTKAAKNISRKRKRMQDKSSYLAHRKNWHRPI